MAKATFLREVLSITHQLILGDTCERVREFGVDVLLAEMKTSAMALNDLCTCFGGVVLSFLDGEFFIPFVGVHWYYVFMRYVCRGADVGKGGGEGGVVVERRDCDMDSAQGRVKYLSESREVDH